MKDLIVQTLNTEDSVYQKSILIGKNLSTGEKVCYTKNPFCKISNADLKKGKINYNSFWLGNMFEKVDKILPKDLISNSRALYKKHIRYNKKKKLPFASKDLFNNIDFRYEIKANLFGSSYAGRYKPDTNTIFICLAYYNWDKLTPEDKLMYKDVLLHELGHFKVSSLRYNEETNVLHCKNGYLKFKFKADVLKSEKDFILINLDESYEKLIIPQEDSILEELSNVAECMEIDPNHKIGYRLYQEIAPVLNQITEGNLIHARYSGGRKSFYKSMKKVIPGENKIIDLFDNISYFMQTPNERLKGKVVDIVKEYAEEKGI